MTSVFGNTKCEWIFSNVKFYLNKEEEIWTLFLQKAKPEVNKGTFWFNLRKKKVCDILTYWETMNFSH